MKITLPDHSIKEIKDGSTALEAAKAIALSLGEKAICAKVNGQLFDLNSVLPGDCEFEVVTKQSKEALEVLRHSAAHLMAEAISHLYPGVQFAYGPATEDGFYYDMKLPKPISEADFPKIEAEMKKIISEKQPIVREEVSYEKALELFKGQKYKTVHIEELHEKGASLSVYRQGDFMDLCLGPHMRTTKDIKAIKIMSTSSCYFQGNKENDSLTRIYGTAFFSQEELDAYLKLLEERKEADHKRLGQQLSLFMFSDYGPGLPFWLPNGMIIRHELESFLWDLLTKEYGYTFLKTPQMLSRELWETSGHWKKYKENMYITKVDGKPYAIKPMNCPGAILVYQNAIHSYRDLPLRYAEFGLDHRHEASGALNGLFRVRAFTQDDAHILLAFDQIGPEIRKMIKMFDTVYSTFGLSYTVELSTRPDKFVGKISTWDKAEAELKACLEENHIPYEINEGDGAFYGPKLDFKIKDSLNRIWQCGTIQLDMQLPHRFHLTYVDKDGKTKEPVMLHRAIFGSFERFFGIITENFKGAFPTWLAPEQVRIIPVNNDEAVVNLAEKLNKRLLKHSIRSKIDSRNEKLSYKIHDSQVFKVPYTIVLGNKEAESGQITYRLYHEQQSKTVAFDEFVKIILKDIKTKAVKRSY
ncbi:MAG: threonine--tRNA ligase [Candidatus Enterosoma sp.]|nr:threonine--tRNA ligase [Candidatus Enterosoma sp.]